VDQEDQVISPQGYSMTCDHVGGGRLGFPHREFRKTLKPKVQAEEETGHPPTE